MSTVGQVERKTQQRVAAFFRDTLGYEHLGDLTDRPDNSNVEETLLRNYLARRGYAATLIERAVYEIQRVAGDQARGLYEVNKDVYRLLRYGVKVSQVGEQTQTVHLIDWENPQNNDFAIAEEVTLHGQHTKRPDIVLYVNGIALGALELKRSSVSVSEGIRQNLINQEKKFIQHFFTTVQLVMAGNDTEGLRYGLIETPEKYYLRWREENPGPDLPRDRLDQDLLHLCNKDRFLEIIHDFIVYDAGIKKTCRQNQYFGVKAAQERVRQHEGGVIWHTQGSGKSLIMVWLANWIRENVEDARVVIITDRVELDQQIEQVFLGVEEDLHRCKSGRDLIEKLDAAAPALLSSIIHKFGAADEDGDFESYIEELNRVVSDDFAPKGDIYVFVDECHRTQSGDLHKVMKKILPEAMFIGFTGTPLLKVDKKKSIETFGPYIHTYKYDQAVKDKVVLDLRYEARDIDQDIPAPEKIDQWFDAKTQGLTEFARSQLKQRWGTMQALYSSQSRLVKIVNDVLLDMAIKDRLSSGRGNALLVAGSIYEACKFYEIFLSSGFEKCAIVTSFDTSIEKIKQEFTGEGLTEKVKQFEIYEKMLNGQPVETFEREAKRKFVKEPGQMKLLIVVDMLLTGFDAPPATYLYIDKSMRDHGLFQAICRVNRLDGDDKEYGYIVDYKDLFQSLESAVQDYTSGAFDGFDLEDVEGLLENRLEKAHERLEEAREVIKALCDPVSPPKDTIDYIEYFCGRDRNDPEQLKDREQKRLALYKLTASFIRAYANLANEMAEAGYSEAEAQIILGETRYYEKVRQEIKLASGDYVDLKLYEPAMRHLIDSYIHADESEKLSELGDMTLLQLIVERGADALDELPEGLRSSQEAVAETIANNVRRLIIEEMPTNPKYFERMSVLLEELIQRRRAEKLAYQAYLEEIIELTRQATNPEQSAAYPVAMDTPAKRALFDNLGKEESLIIRLDEDIRSTKKEGWRGNLLKEREVRNVIARHVPKEEVERIFELVVNQGEY